MSELLKDWVGEHARHRPCEVALSDLDSGEQRTWAQLEQRVGRAARVLLDSGIGRGDRVVLVAENDLRIFELQFACMRLGAVLVPLNWRLAIPELLEQVRGCAPSLLVHDAAWAEVTAQLGGELPRLGWAGPDSAWERALAGVTGPVRGTELDPDAVTHVLYTSGTTGAPKGVLCTNRTLVTQALNLAHSSRFAERGNHHLNIVPLFHAGGLNVFTNPMLFWGGRVSTVRRFDATRTIELLDDAELGVTHLCGVLQMFEWMTAAPRFATASFPAVRSILFGGWGSSAAAICRAWAARGVDLQLSYGASELGPNVTILAEPDPEAAERGTSGTVLPHTAVRLAGSDGTEVAQGQVGEIWVRGPGVTPGYWGQSRELSVGAWFRTGDAGYLDDRGHLYVVGRMRDVYRSGGENIYPAEVEAALAELPNVRELAVVGVPDEKWGEAGLLVVVPEPGATVTLEDARDHVAGRLARFKLPAALLVVDELPRSATDKVSRATLRETWLALHADA